MTANRVVAGRFELVEQVGAGGMGTVWRARDQRLHRDVALKEIRLPVDPRGRLGDQYERVLREARAAVRLGTHPGVAQVYDVSDQQADPPWIAMEFITGRSLDKVISSEGPLSPLRVAEIGRQILETLRAGHAAGVLHRDLKPGNVMITAGGRVILTDFGIAKILGEPTLTATGALLGTPGYIAPERVRGLPGTEASDLYALGATLAAALRPPAGFGPATGTLTLSGPAGAEASTVIITKPITGMPLAPDVPGQLMRLIESLRSDAPEDRPSASVAAQILDSVITELRHEANGNAQAEAPGALRPARGRHTRTGRRLAWQRRRAVALIAVGCVLVVGLSAAFTGGFGLVGRTSGGGTALVSAFRVAAVADVGPDVFAVEGNGVLEHKYYRGGKWQGWYEPGTSADDSHVTGIPSLARDGTGREEAFARTAGGTLLRWWQGRPGLGWDGPKPFGSTRVTSDPSVIALPGGELEVFARLPDGTLGVSLGDRPGPSAAWSHWQSLGGSLSGAPVATLDVSGVPRVFAITPHGGLAFTSMAGATWSGWSMLPGQSDKALSGVPAVVANSSGVEVFARTAAGTLNHWHEQPGSTSWTSPVQLGSGLSSDPVAALDASGRLEVFAVLRDGSVAMTRQVTAGNPAAWSAWSPTGFTASSSLAALVTDSQTYVFAREANGAIAGIAGTPTTGWSPIQLGGSF